MRKLNKSLMTVCMNGSKMRFRRCRNSFTQVKWLCIRSKSIFRSIIESCKKSPIRKNKNTYRLMCSLMHQVQYSETSMKRLLSFRGFKLKINLVQLLILSIRYKSIISSVSFQRCFLFWGQWSSLVTNKIKHISIRSVALRIRLKR